MDEFTGKLAVITGGASGVGCSLAFALAGAGARILVADVDAKALAATRDALEAAGATAHARACDVTDPSSLGDLAAFAFDTLGGVQLVFANAGVASGEAGPLWGYADNDWKWCFEVNFWGVVNTINAFMPRLTEQGEESHLVITGSANGAFLVYPDQPIYSAAKAAVQVVAEALFHQTSAPGNPVQVHALFPGPHVVETGIFDSDRVRPERFAKPSSAPDTGIHSAEDLRRLMEAFGTTLETTHPDEVAQTALDGIRRGRFWILPLTPATESQIKARTDAILARTDPPVPTIG
ncbi:MAG: SDR family NAD(P)-dependent oxidoreductase [Gammaproteobacteria bacterium]|nr:SDR family NAD(P)-dependent oxidoreductase [Gammaproteobacteria bacterium]MDE0450253.1 SDR family NAD(P)-dependent oxidoreductase [Gammaproteobacteria bacterium]